MTGMPSPAPSYLRPLLLLGVSVSLAAVGSGALVTAAGAGAACPAWPLCLEGALLPPPAFAGGLAFAHRLLVAVTLGLILLLALLALRMPRSDRLVRQPLLLAPLLLMIGLPLDRLMIEYQLFDLLRLSHLAIALLLLGCQVLALVALLSGGSQAEQRLGGQAAARYRRYIGTAWWAAGASLVLTLAGSALPPTGISPQLGAIGGLPANAGGALLISGLLVGAVGWQTWRSRRGDRLLLGAAALALALVGLEAAIMLLVAPPAGSVIIGALLWSATLALAVLATHRPLPSAAVIDRPARPLRIAGQPSLLADYLSLTKPKVISLLLVTTLAAMFITEKGAPGWWLVLWTMLGGYLAAGGAGAINCAFDSDIDINMGRTSRRPVPSGRISRRAAMRFGLALSLLSALVLLLFTTPLAMIFSCLGILYYAVFYTRWLKRSTWQNIVIGGGAGAIPPLVGWTAVTGNLSLPAIMLFAIIFYWTPPHFWALALIKEKDYARAGVPMLPVVAGAQETRFQILVYSLMMVALSTLLTPLGAMGWIYLLTALLLGGLFLRDAWQVYRHGEQQDIWRLYKYSLLYLALLFVAMIVDRAVLG